MKIAIASDHAGYELKRQLKEFFVKISFIDVGTFSEESVDYPDYAHTRQLNSIIKEIVKK